MFARLIICAAMLLAATRVAAQRAPSPTPAIFLPQSYIMRTAPTKRIMYEAHPQVSIFLYSKFDHLFDRLLRAGDTAGKAYVLAIVPEYTIRQIADGISDPVRTPSFQPKVVGQVLWAERWGNRFRSGMEITEPVIWVRELQTTLGHYSNGQEGCFLASEVPDQDGRCVRQSFASPDADSLNTLTGSFSTHYVRVAGHSRWFKLDAAGSKRHAVTVGAALEWHPNVGFGGMAKQLGDMYGRLRPMASVDAMKSTNWPPCIPARFVWTNRIIGHLLPCEHGFAKLAIEAEGVPRRPPGIPPIRWRARYTQTYERLSGLGFLIGVHRGQDYYNMSFSRRFNVTEFGLVFDPERDIRVPRDSSR